MRSAVVRIRHSRAVHHAILSRLFSTLTEKPGVVFSLSRFARLSPIFTSKRASRNVAIARFGAEDALKFIKREQGARKLTAQVSILVVSTGCRSKAAFTCSTVMPFSVMAGSALSINTSR
jgi:hypothetical protein